MSDSATDSTIARWSGRRIRLLDAILAMATPLESKLTIDAPRTCSGAQHYSRATRWRDRSRAPMRGIGALAPPARRARVRPAENGIAGPASGSRHDRAW